MTSTEKRWTEIPPAGVCWQSSSRFLTGDWKTYTPVLNVDKCTRCLLCVLFCPDGAIHWNSTTKDIIFDLDFCKGCGICANECPTQAIDMKL